MQTPEMKRTERNGRMRGLLGLALLVGAACGDAASPQADGDGSKDEPSSAASAEAGTRDHEPSSSTADAGSTHSSPTADAKVNRPADAAADATSSANGSSAEDAAVPGNNGQSDGSTPAGDGMSACAGGTVGKDSTSAKTPGLDVSREYGALKYVAASGIQILSLKTTMLVPVVPTQKQTLFIWPALQNRAAADPARVGNGILQPVLTWGGSCNPKLPSASEYYSQWWIAGMYVNVSSSVAGPTGCAGGDYMLTNVGDSLDMEISLKGTAWTQTIVNTTSHKTVDFTIDLKGQVQNWATWAVEVPDGENIAPTADTVFTQNVLTFSAPVKTCQPSQAGAKDYFSAPVLSSDGLRCCYDQIILKKH